MRLSGSERRQSILEAAVGLVEQYGFRGTSTQAIARQAAISDALIFKHFKSLDDLYAALCHEYITPLTEVPLEESNTVASSLIYSYIRMFLIKNLQNPRSFRLYAMAQYERPDLISGLTEKAESSETLHTLTSRLEDAFGSRDRSSWAVTFLHHSLMDMTRQYNLNAREGQEFDIDETAKQLTRLILGNH